MIQNKSGFENPLFMTSYKKFNLPPHTFFGICRKIIFYFLGLIIFFFKSLDFFSKLWKNFKSISHYSIICSFKERSIRIIINHEFMFGSINSCQMLNSSVNSSFQVLLILFLLKLQFQHQRWLLYW